MENRWIAPKTQAALEVHLPPVLADLAHVYLLSPEIASRYSGFGKACAGCGELCEHLTDQDLALQGAAAGGHIEIVKRMIVLGATDFIGAAVWARFQEHTEISSFLRKLEMERIALKSAWVPHTENMRKSSKRERDTAAIDIRQSRRLRNKKEIYGRAADASE